MDNGWDDYDVITAPTAPQVPMTGAIGAPLQTFPFSKQEENENLPYPTLQNLKKSNGWIIWDISDIIKHFSIKRRPTPMCYYSPFFQIVLGNKTLEWQMCFAAVDIDKNYGSLYLGSFDSQNDDQLFLETTFALKICHEQDLTLYFLDDIQHVFHTRSRWWGIQNVLDMKWWDGCGGKIRVGVKNNKCDAIGTSLRFPYKQLIHEDPYIFRVCDRPFIVCQENFLSNTECQQVIKHAKPHLSPSLVQSGGLTDHRKSSSMFFTEDLKNLDIVKTIEKRLQDFINLPVILDGYAKQKPQETLQVIHYKEGEFYRPHLDNKDNRQPIRVATIIIYLNDVQEGGCTNFKLARQSIASMKQGLKIHPKKGLLIMFWNREPYSYMQDLSTLHEAEPVTKGEKWILTRWFRDEVSPTYDQWLQQKQQKKLIKKWKNSCDRLISTAAAVPFQNKNKL